MVIHKHLGACLVHTRDFEAAIEELNAFLKTTPNDAEAQYDLAVALRETGKKDEAKTYFSRSLVCAGQSSRSDGAVFSIPSLKSA